MWVVRAVRGPSSTDDGNARDKNAVRWLAFGFLVLGLVRAVPHQREIVGAFLSLAHADDLGFSRFPVLSEVEALAAIALLWPAVFAFILWLLPSRLAVRAGAVTAVTIVGSAVAWLVMPTTGRAQLLASPEFYPTIEGLLDEIAGGILFVLALRLELTGRPGTPTAGDVEKAGRRAIAGRLTVLASLLFFVITFCGHGWDVFQDLLARSQSARTFVLNIGDAAPQQRGGPRLLGPGDQELVRRLNKAMELNYSRRFLEAIEAYDQAIETLSRLDAHEGTNRNRTQTRSLVLNDLAWLLATCADPSVREPERSVSLAKEAVDLAPEEGNVWNTLGVAHYRAGDWHSALSALERSMELRNGGAPHDWFFVAMIQVKLGDRDDAGRWYDKGVEAVEASRRFDEELYRFRAEAAGLLGRSVPPPPTISDQRAPFNPVPAIPLPPKPGG